MKFYKIETFYGDYKIISFNKNIAIIRAYLKYKKDRKTLHLENSQIAFCVYVLMNSF